MSKLKEIVIRVPRHYVGKDCIQTMMAYRGCMVLISPSGIIFHDQSEQDYIHEYLSDKRKIQFPYSDIHRYKGRISLRKYEFATHLLDFETPYLGMTGEGIYTESFAVKDGDEALLINKILLPTLSHIRKLTKRELERMFVDPTAANENQYILHNGKLCKNLTMVSDDVLVENFKKQVIQHFTNIVDIDETGQRSLNPDFGMFERLIKNISIKDIPENFHIANVIIIKSDGKDINMKIAFIRFIRPNQYEVEFNFLPITRYTLEQLKAFPIIHKAKEPRINRILNPEIPRATIVAAKKMVMK